MRRTLRRRLERALCAAGREGAVVCLSLSDDEELLELNRQYADEDHATDVLSFSQLEAAEAVAPVPHAPVLLGDIVISVETAERQARERGHGLPDELLHLAVHGLCHLLGYDHATAEEERIMFGYEAELRIEASAKRPVRTRPMPPSPSLSAGIAATASPHG
jgi:probable rRNA maturation factor